MEWRKDRSFDVLDLFANLLQLGLHLDDLLRNLRGVCLRTDGIDFPSHLLRKKIQSATDRLIGFEAIPKLVQVAAEPRDFLRDVTAIRKKNDLLHQPLIVQRNRSEEHTSELQSLSH